MAMHSFCRLYHFLDEVKVYQEMFIGGFRFVFICSILNQVNIFIPIAEIIKNSESVLFLNHDGSKNQLIITH